MRHRLFAVPSLILACAVPAAFAAKPATRPAPPTPMFINGVRDTGQFLADSVVICRVADRATTVGKFIEEYFHSYAEDRPNADSAGRVQFLNTLIHRDVLGLIAREINPPMRFEDRVTLREFQQSMLSTMLYERAVSDSSAATEQEIAREYEAFKYQVRLRHIVFADRATADRVRLDLVRGRASWKQAYDKYSLSKGKDRSTDGEMGWIVRGNADLTLGRKVFTLGAGGISEPIQNNDGFNVVQVMEKREIVPPSLEAVRNVIRDQLTAEKVGGRSKAIRDAVRRQIGMTYDSTAIAWAAAHFVDVRSAPNPGEIAFNTSLPDFAPADTGRVLARFRDGVFTLGQFFAQYSQIQALMRPSVSTPEQFSNQVDGFVFEPYFAQVAIERGLDRDPVAIARLENKREQLMIDHVYQDSILSRVSVTSKQRRQYYDQHREAFVTYRRVRFASLWEHDKAAADSLAARLRAGEKAEDIIRADSLLGVTRGAIQERAENEHGPGQKALFEEMKPGDIQVDGPNKQGDWIVFQSLESIPGRQLPFDEVQQMIDDSLQNTESERLLDAFLARHRASYAIESHPDWVMRIRLVDPSLN